MAAPVSGMGCQEGFQMRLPAKIIAVVVATVCMFISVLKGIGDPDAFWHFMLGLTAGCCGILYYGVRE